MADSTELMANSTDSMVNSTDSMADSIDSMVNSIELKSGYIAEMTDYMDISKNFIYLFKPQKTRNYGRRPFSSSK